MNQFSHTDKASVPFIKILILLLLLVTPALNADAKWWIFGKSDDAGVSTRYLYINDLSYDELGEKVTLYKDSLPQGAVNIRGKGTAGKNRVGAVQISLDGKQTWQKAQVASDGSFIYSFTPEANQTYELYVKVLDTTGKSNDIEASRKEMLVSDESIQDEVYKTLDQLVKAYQDEDSFAFMRLVSYDFVSGTALLDSAVRNDFTAFDNIQLHYNLNNVTSANDGNLFVAISFSRMVTSSRSGDTFSDKASTEFTFKIENGVPKIYSMKNPLVFGLSDTANIATGTVNSGSNEDVLTVDNSGTVELKPISEIENDSISTTAETPTETTTPAETPTRIITLSSPPSQGFMLTSGMLAMPASADIYLETNIIWSDTGAGQQSLGSTAIESITTVPSSGYGGWPVNVVVGDTYALRLGSGKYALIQFTNYTDDGSANTTATIKYRYQTDGSQSF